MQEFTVSVTLKFLAEDRTNARFLVVTALMEHLPLGSGPSIEEIEIKEET